MMNNHRLREQLDAYRGASDLARPEMAALAQSLLHDKAATDELARSQRFDRAVAAGLADVPVPAGLEDRLLAKLDAAKYEPVQKDLPLAAAVGDAISATDNTGAAKRLVIAAKKSQLRAVIGSRRTWSAGITALAVLVLACGTGYYWHRSRQIIEQEQIASALGGWQRAAKSSRPERGLPSDFVLPPLPVKPVRYVPFKTDEGWSAVAVDCTTTTGSPATLYIVESSANFRVGTSSITRLAASGKKVAAWKKGRLLYVLVEEVAKPRAGAAIQYPSAPPA